MQTGMLIDGKYKIIKQIGRGGMSVVYLAMDVRLKKEWAIKEISKSAGEAAAKKDFYHLIAEADLMKRLDHPALPRIVDIIEDEQKIYIVMDYIRGVSLDQVVCKYGAQPEKTVIGWGIQLCDALRYLHGQKPPIIYRDMKPANVLLTAGGSLKLVDLGIAREYKERHASDTALLGTRGYAPPEQHGLRQTDVRSDIYALGMTLHHLLTGADPGKSGYVYVSARQMNPSLSIGIEAIINKCTALNPGERYQSCDELLYDLHHPKEVGEEQIWRARRKQRLWILAVIAALSLTVSGVISHVLNVNERDREYQKKIEISSSAPYEAKIKSYLEAMALSEADPRAYICLLTVYREQGKFGDKESQQFISVFDAHKTEFDHESEEYLELLYEAGITYFYLYSGAEGEEERFVSRVLKAYPFFREIAASRQIEYRNFEIADSYAKIGEFYTRYVVNIVSVQEPEKEVYEDLLTAVCACLKAAEDYKAKDSAYVRLTIYQAIVNLLNNQRRGFAVAGVRQDSVQEVYDLVYQNTESLYVTQEASMDLREAILDTREEYLENLQRAYENAANWRSASKIQNKERGGDSK